MHRGKFEQVKFEGRIFITVKLDIMKTRFTFLLWITAILSYGSTSLRVQNPQTTWHYYQSSIDSATLSIKPKGAYFECGLYLTFSAKPIMYSNDTFEVQMMFDLPEGSFVHDSWLWVNNQIVQASIIERNRAQLIYEGIVQRRRDPSILYKNSSTQYELRVYPMAASGQRKVKITYMVPAIWGLSTVSCPVPMNIFKASAIVPNVEILSYTDSIWNTPAITEVNNIAFSPVPSETFTKAVIPAQSIQTLSDVNYTLQSPMQNGLFTSIYPIGTTEGYYQMVLMPSQAISLNNGQKTAFLFDYELGNSNSLPSDFLSKTRQVLLSNYSATDSFNLLFSQFSIYQYSPTWLPCDTHTINTIFNYLDQHNPISSYSNLPSLLAQSIQFIKTHGNQGNMVLFTNTSNNNSPQVANQLVSDVLALMGPNKIPIHIADLQDLDLYYTWVNGQYYYGGEYLYSNLAILTGGNYENIRANNSYYYYNWRTFAETINALIEKMQGRISSCEVYTDATNGFCYSNFDNIKAGVAYINKPYIRIGRYSGNLPLTTELTGLYNGQVVSQSFTLNNYFEADSFTRKMWVANYISEIEEQSNLSSQSIADVVNFSLNNRVLSKYTAFLALEPSDSTLACTDCDDETTPGATSISETTASPLSIKAFPNPFSNEVSLQIHLEENTATIKIYNTLGQIVKEFVLNNEAGNDLTINWDGTDNNGETLSAGIYVVSLETAKTKTTIRIVKS